MKPGAERGSKKNRSQNIQSSPKKESAIDFGTKSIARGASVFVALRRDKGEASPTRLASIPQPVVRARGK